MPVYEYQCSACNRDFEYQQRMSDPDKTTCEVCGGALERLISRTAFSLKGGGWYKDLYASPKPAETKADTGAKADAPAASADKPAVKSSDSGSGGTQSTGSASAAGSTSAAGSSSGSGGSTSAAAAKVP